MTKKPSGPADPMAERSAPVVAVAVRRKRAQVDTIDLTVRVAKADWVRLQELAIGEGTSMQALTRAGLSRIFADRGLPALEP